MKWYYCSTTGGFYNTETHESIPGNAVEISEGLHGDLVNGQSEGMVIMPPDENHTLPYLADPLPPTAEELAEQARTERDRLLDETDYLVMPDYPINAEDLDAVKVYRQALRDVTEQQGFPQDVMWPEKPEIA